MNHESIYPITWRRSRASFALLVTCLVVAAAACTQDVMQPAAGMATPAPTGGVAGPTGAAPPSTAPSGSPAPSTTSPTATGVPNAMPNVPAATPGATPTADPSLPQLPATTPLSQLPAQCKGFEVLGMMQSPGGSTLPNKCAPFHGTYNNPYAIRCIDANPDYKTRWAGDEYCILPPPPDQGLQIYIGPTSYDDAAEVAKYELMPGQESNTNYYINSKNTERVFYYRTNYRMREGSHHMIVSLQASDRADGWAGPGELADTGFGGVGFGGAQRADSDRPSNTLEVPPENVGLGGELQPNQQFNFNLHHMNRFDEPILREAWVNVWYAKDVTQPQRGATLFGNFADVSIPPGEHRPLHYASTVSGDMRIVQYFGHRHVSTDRFAIWIERTSGEKISAYESFEWEDMPVYQYDSVSQNPVPDVMNKVDGGHTGLLELKNGDEVHFLCDITNRQQVMLKFSNELYSGEMCIVFGTAVGSGSLGMVRRVMD